jgi:hypothetical protein
VPPHAQQIILTHHPQHALVVDLEASPLQLEGDSAVAVGRPLPGDFLHLIPDFHLHRYGLRLSPAIETGPVEPGHLTQRVHRFAFPGSLLDFFKQTTSPLAPAGG